MNWNKEFTNDRLPLTEKSPSNKNGILLIKSFFKFNEVPKKNDKI